MPRYARIIVNDQKSVYHVMSRTALDKYPFGNLEKDEFVFRLWSVVENYAICLIVFNVYNQMKKELWDYHELDEDDFIDLDY